LRFNQKYAAKLETKLAKKRAAEQARASALAETERHKQTEKANPFSVSTKPHA
jgi:pre-rRNA-processing protein TSR4